MAVDEDAIAAAAEAKASSSGRRRRAWSALVVRLEWWQCPAVGFYGGKREWKR